MALDADGHDIEVRVDGKPVLRLTKEGAIEAQPNPEWDLRDVYDALCRMRRLRERKAG